MSTKATRTASKKPTASKKTTETTRFNIFLAPEDREKSAKLMELEHRNFSNLLAVLIAREYERHFGKPA